MKAVSFIKTLNKDLEGCDKDEKKRVLKKGYLRYCSQHGVCNTIQAYRAYRKACRGALGFDLPMTRPQKPVAPIEVEGSLF